MKTIITNILDKIITVNVILYIILEFIIKKNIEISYKYGLEILLVSSFIMFVEIILGMKVEFVFRTVIPPVLFVTIGIVFMFIKSYIRGNNKEH